MIIFPKLAELDGGRREAVHIMDEFRRRTIENIKMLTEVDGWTDGRTPVRRGLVQIKQAKSDGHRKYTRLVTIDMNSNRFKIDGFWNFWNFN